jgi:futalosine hydrolase
MNILVVAATEIELSGIRHGSTDMLDRKVRTLVTGVGMLPSAYSIMQEISLSKPDMILQIGIAGSFREELPPGTAVVVEREIIADMGVHENGGYRDVFELGLAGKNIVPYEDGAVVNPHVELLSAIGIPAVRAVSVNEISSSPERISLFKNAYHSDIESMEGAALHYTCSLQQIPFMQIRGISNMVGERDKSKWKIKESLGAATAACISFISKIDQP